MPPATKTPVQVLAQSSNLRTDTSPSLSSDHIASNECRRLDDEQSANATNPDARETADVGSFSAGGGQPTTGAGQPTVNESRTL